MYDVFYTYDIYVHMIRTFLLMTLLLRHYMSLISQRALDIKSWERAPTQSKWIIQILVDLTLSM